MNFFESQDSARKNTGRLILLFSIAVLVITVAVYLLVIAVAYHAGYLGKVDTYTKALLNPRLMLYVGGGTLAVIFFASVFRMMELRQGGSVIASSLGGNLVDLNTEDPDERKLLNIVEEMSIASGVPVPDVYILDQEQAINAFAAGNSMDDAVIGVTRGCVRILNRDELQGVVAHEFSHILNGDMRLSLKLIGWVHGILCIALLGRLLLEGAFWGGDSGRSRRRERDGGGLGIALLILGLGLLLIGSIGSFFSGWIKGAVSRQREFLADAAAVQFTRNPEGIAGALMKIGGFSRGSVIRSGRAEEASHLFFGNGVRFGFASLFATHPPLEKRIKAILPNWDGRFAEVEAPVGGGFQEAGLSGFSGGGHAVPVEPVARARKAPSIPRKDVEQVIQFIGGASAASLEQARALIDSIPADLRNLAHEAFGARALVYGLLLSAAPDSRSQQQSALEASADPGVLAELSRWMPMVDGLEEVSRLPLLDLCLPALRMLSDQQYQRFRENVNVLIESDQQLDLFEYMVKKVLEKHLDAHFHPVKRTVVSYYSIKGLREEGIILISALARLGGKDDESREVAFAQGMRVLGLDGARLQPLSRANLKAIHDSLVKFEQASPILKKRLIEAGAHTVASDGFVDAKELQLLRAVADDLDCPLALIG